MSNEVELKDCPFCGNYGVGPCFAYEVGANDIWQVECGKCGYSIECELGFEGDAARKAAVDRWNTRALERTLPISCEDEITEAMICADDSAGRRHRPTMSSQEHPNLLNVLSDKMPNHNSHD